jgi:hypothetical protein
MRLRDSAYANPNVSGNVISVTSIETQTRDAIGPVRTLAQGGNGRL